MDEGREILRDVRIYDACSFYTYGNYVLDVRIFKADELALDGRIELASATTQFSMSRYLTPGESILPPPASGVKAWLEPDPRTLGMRVGEWHRFKLRSDILLYLNDHSGIQMYGSQSDFFVAPGETTPSNSVEEACQGPYFLNESWRRAIHQALWIGACKAGDGVIEVRHETDAVDPLYEYEFRTLARVYNSEPTLTIANVRAAEGDGDMVFTVALSHAISDEVTVDYATQVGTATEGTDYTLTEGTLTFPANSTTPQEIRVPILDDTVDESDETFTVELSNAQNAALDIARATVSDNDDTPPPPSATVTTMIRHRTATATSNTTTSNTTAATVSTCRTHGDEGIVNQYGRELAGSGRGDHLEL